MLTLQARWRDTTVYIDVLCDGKVIDQRQIKDIPADIYNSVIVPDLIKQAAEMDAEIELCENQGDESNSALSG